MAAELAQLADNLGPDLTLLERASALARAPPERTRGRWEPHHLPGLGGLAAGQESRFRLQVMRELRDVAGQIEGDTRGDPMSVLGEADRRSEELVQALRPVFCV